MPQTPAVLSCPTSGWMLAPPATPGGMRHSGSWSEQVQKEGGGGGEARGLFHCHTVGAYSWCSPCAEISCRASAAAGELHNNSRMYWGKAFLQWAPSPQAALRWVGGYVETAGPGFCSSNDFASALSRAVRELPLARARHNLG